MTQLTTAYINHTFGGLIDASDVKISDFITDHTGDYDDNGEWQQDDTGTLTLSASDSLELQQLMADQSITAQTSTSTLKSVKDSIIAASRNI